MWQRLHGAVSFHEVAGSLRTLPHGTKPPTSPRGAQGPTGGGGRGALQALHETLHKFGKAQLVRPSQVSEPSIMPFPQQAGSPRQPGSAQSMAGFALSLIPLLHISVVATVISYMAESLPESPPCEAVTVKEKLSAAV